MLKALFTVIFSLLIFVESSRINDQLCDNQLDYFNKALKNRDEWALSVFDMWAKFQSGVMRGNLANPSGFTDCVNFRHSNATQLGNFQGQHCMVRYSATLKENEINTENGFDWRVIGSIARRNNFNFRGGICVPATCSEAKVLEYANLFLSQADLLGTSVTCQTNDPIPFEVIDIVAIVVFSFFGLLLVSSTLYEIIMIKNDRESNKLLIAFSVYNNGWKLYDVTPSKSTNSIDCLNGIRALSFLFIIFGHRYGASMWQAISNRREFEEWYLNIHASVFHTHQVPVDTFFMMGGLLVTISILQSLDNKRLNVWRMYLHRYLRYTPLLAAILLFLLSLVKFFIFGPMTYIETRFVRNCEKWWWTTLLHIQNYVNPNEACMGHSWYLSIDFQLFIISPLLIYPAWKYGWKFLWILPMLALASSFYIFVMSMEFNIYVVQRTPEVGPLFIKYIYYPTHARMGPWLIGMTMGYILYKNRSKKIRVSPLVNALLWIICLSIFTAITLGSHPFFLNPSINETTLLANAFYLAFHRNGWALAVAWMVFACQNGTGGIIRWFLSLPQWQPLSRMGLSMYLTSWLFQHSIIMSTKVPVYFDEFEWLHKYWGDIFATIIISTMTYLTFETPFMLVENYIYKKIQTSKIGPGKIMD